MSGLSWTALCASAVAIIPPWSPPTWYLIATGILLGAVGWRALNGRV